MKQVGLEKRAEVWNETGAYISRLKSVASAQLQPVVATRNIGPEIQFNLVVKPSHCLTLNPIPPVTSFMNLDKSLTTVPVSSSLKRG